jgi:uracil phosphoribosyltransferase
MTDPSFNVHVIDHPLVQHKLTLMRKQRGQHQQLSPPAQRAGHADGL